MRQTHHRFSQRQNIQRHELQQSLQQHLEVFHHPRLVMLGLIVTAALSAFVLSFGLRILGVTDLALRYLIVWVLVYLLFIGLVRLWASWHLSDKDSGLDIGIGDLIPESSGARSPSASSYEGQQGGFGGSGAKGSWTDSPSTPTNSGSGLSANVISLTGSDAKSSSSLSSKSESILDEVGDVGEGGLPIVIVMALLAVAASLLGGLAWMTYSLVDTAPILLAELLADVMIVNGLGQRMRTLPSESEHWFFAIWKRTQTFFWMVVGLIVVLFAVLHLGHIQVQTLGELFGKL